MEKPLIILTGPTAVGKTKLSVSLAERIGGEIISADSMQVYKGMDIGTAKITKEEMRGVPHHLINICEPWEEFNVTIFKRYADRYIGEILDRGHIPIIAGGTGFYIDAVLYDTDFTAQDDGRGLRKELFDYAEKNGNAALHDRLREIDPEYAASVHPNNVKRVARAIEYYALSKEKLSLHNERERKKAPPYNYAYFVLDMDRKKLYSRISERVDRMVADGLCEEVKKLMSLGCGKDMVSMKGIGYKEFIEFYDGTATFEEAVSAIKRETRHFAKRQLTWFRRESGIIWLNKDKNSDDALIEGMIRVLREKGIVA